MVLLFSSPSSRLEETSATAPSAEIKGRFNSGKACYLSSRLISKTTKRQKNGEGFPITYHEGHGARWSWKLTLRPITLYPLYRRQDGPRAIEDGCDKSPFVTDVQTPNCPAGSLSSYRLSFSCFKFKTMYFKMLWLLLCIFSCMGVNFVTFLEGHRLRVLIIECWGEYLGLSRRMWQADKKHFKVSSLIMCTYNNILLVW